MGGLFASLRRRCAQWCFDVWFRCNAQHACENRQLERYAQGRHLNLCSGLPSKHIAALRRLGATPASVTHVDIADVLEDLPDGHEFVRTTANSLPFPDGHFDSVFMQQGLCCSAPPKNILREFVRVCRVGGRVLLYDRPVKCALVWSTPDDARWTSSLPHELRKCGVDMFGCVRYTTAGESKHGAILVPILLFAGIRFR